MRRRAFRIILFLLLGAIVNVAVAWGCAWHAMSPGTESVGAPLLDPPRRLTPQELRRSSLECGPGRVPIWSQRTTFGVRLRDALGIPESWLLAGRIVSEDASGLFMADVSAGFPMWSLSGEWWVESARDLPWLWRPADWPPLDGRGIPLRPIWPGFAINTVFYAVVLWLLFAGPFVVRRRRRIRRGLCPKCAYDLRGTVAKVCPECGAAVLK